MTLSNPKLSVIIPYYNHGRYLNATVQSALASYSGSMEIIIVNDGSKEKLAETYLNSAKMLSDSVVVLKKENGGLSSARNLGLDAARGEYIQFLDSDDMLFPGKINRQIAHLTSDSTLMGSICGYAFTDPWMVKFDVGYDSIARFPLNLGSFLMLWERGFSVPIHSALFEASVFNELRFNTSVEGKEDWIFWCQLLSKTTKRLGYLPFLGAAYRGHEESMTRSSRRMASSYITAAKTIQSFIGSSYPGFLDASREWYDSCYLPRIADEEWDLEHAQAQSSAPVLPIYQENRKKEVLPKLKVSVSKEFLGLISLVIPVFNHSNYLDQCIASAVSQAGISEIIIIDDCSTEELVREKLIEWAEFDDRIKLIFNDSNNGIAESQNQGVALATSEYVGFLDCDDALQVNASLALCSAIKENNSDYFFTDRYNIDEKGALVQQIKYGGYDWIAPSSNIQLDLFLGMVASHWKVIRKSSYLAAGGSSSALTGVQDWDLALKLLHSSRFHHIQEPLYRHRIHSNSVTSSAMMGQFWKTNVSRRNYLKQLRARTPSEYSSTTTIESELNLDLIKQLAPRLLKGEKFVLDRRHRQLSIDEVNLVREFNSFFEEIKLSDTDGVSVLGYLWSEKSLVSLF